MYPVNFFIDKVTNTPPIFTHDLISAFRAFLRVACSALLTRERMTYVLQQVWRRTTKMVARLRHEYGLIAQKVALANRQRSPTLRRHHVVFFTTHDV